MCTKHDGVGYLKLTMNGLICTVYVWCMYSVCVVYVQCMCGVCTVYVWCVYSR